MADHNVRNNKIVVVGASGHAKVIVDILQREGKYEIMGFLDRVRSAGDELMGYPILGSDESLPELMVSHGIMGAIVAIGDNFLRSKVAACIRELCPSLTFVRAIHPSASLANGVTVGEGSAIMAGACVNSNTSIGRFCIVNTGSSLDHDSSLGDFASLAPGVTTGGNCHIGMYSAVCIGATLSDGIQIGEHSIVGAGSLVLKSIESLLVVYGSPARVIRPRLPGDKYL
jgi:sugar O-acyltransferase (sialic acid O-acetyltransferase NeuD family)